MCRCYSADAYVGAFVVVFLVPLCCVMLCLLAAFANGLIEPFRPNCFVIALDIRILLWLVRLNMLDCDVVFFSPLQQLIADVFRSVIDPNVFWSAPPLDDIV